MRCPNCQGELKPWPWQDGGYKGIECEGCGQQWWSDSFASAAHDAERAATATLIGQLGFPPDAITDAEFRRQADELRTSAEDDPIE